jgi:alpha-tubulin suppressor-like RCC1 family protein
MKKHILSIALTVILYMGVCSSFASPVLAEEDGNLINTIAAGETGYAIKSDGSLWAWGINVVVNGIRIQKCLTPVKVMDDIKSISGGIIKNDNSLWIQHRSIPVDWRPEFDFDYGDDPEAYNVASNQFYHFMDDVKTAGGASAIKQDNSLWLWGRDDGLYATLDALGATSEYRGYNAPTKIMDDVKAVQGGDMYTMLLKTDGSLWARGLNYVGQFGDGTTESKATFVKTMDGVKSFSTFGDGAFSHTMILKEDGSLWACGSNYDGAIGDGTATGYRAGVVVVDNDRYTPVKIMDDVKSVEASSWCSFAIKEDHSLWGWGTSISLGIGLRPEDVTASIHSDHLLPAKLMDNVADISVGVGATLILKLDGSLWGYGNNQAGQLGDGTTEQRTSPVKIMDGVMLPTAATTTPPTQPATPVHTYIYGQNRVLTSVAISQQGWTNSNTVILAPGGDANLMDALTVAPLAYQENAPILLSVENTLDPAVLAEIQRLGATRVLLVGALSQNIAAQLRAARPGLTIETLRGQDRFETANLVNARVNAPKGTFIIGYNALADAVSAASYAAANSYIIQIAQPDGSFTADTSLGGYILGGPALVSNLSGFTRLYGTDRYATNQVIRNTLAYDYTDIFIADGNTLVDALTGSVLAAKTRSAIVLTPNNNPAGTDFGGITPETKVYALGGAK